MRRGQLTRRGHAFAFLGLLVVATGILLGYPDATRIGVLLLLLPLIAMIWISRRLPHIRVARSVEPARLGSEERGRVTVDLTNTGSRRTMSYLAEEQFHYALGDRPRFVLPALHPGETRRLQYPVRSRHRGVYRLGPVTLHTQDPFGLTSVDLLLPRTDEILILPRLFELSTGIARGHGRGSEGEQPQMIALHGEDDVSIRNYRDGDELRRVHWPATAHRGELMVRQEDQPTRRRAIIVLDDRRAGHPGRGHHPSFEWAISAAGSVARHLVKDGFVVHIITHATVADGSSGQPLEIDPMLTLLARAETTVVDDLDPLVAAAHDFTSGGVLVIAIVSAYDHDQLRHLAAIRSPGSPAVAMLLDSTTFAGQPGPSAHAPAGAHRPPTPGFSDLSAILTSAGWTVAPVRSGDPIPKTWETIWANRQAEAVR